MGSLVPESHQIPKFTQIYLYDSFNEQAQLRMAHFSEVSLDP
jgi:hypothetical protein